MNETEHAATPRPYLDRLPPHAFFMVSAVFHYLGPSFAVLLFQHVGVLGVAWLRIATAGVIFGVLRRPWRMLRTADRRTRLLVLALGAVLALMNCVFYLAIERLPLATVAAIEFVAIIGVALVGVRGLRNLLALAVAVVGVYLLIGFKGTNDWLGLAFTVANAVLFAAYVMIGHAISRAGGAGGIDRLGVAMLIATAIAMPMGLGEALTAFADWRLLLAAIGVGLSSSVIPYVCDQLAMARLPRATFALMLSLLPATASVVGALVLRQVPSAVELTGIMLVAIGVGIHKPAP